MIKNKDEASVNEILTELLRLSLPSILGLMVISLYGTIDSVFVGKGIGTDAVAALAVVFPFSLIVLAFAQLFGIGGQSVISRALGAKDNKKVSSCITTVFYSTFFLSILLIVFFKLFEEPLLELWGANEQILNLSKDYFNIVINGTLFLLMFISFNNIIRGEGKAIRAMLTLVITALTNTILNYIFIFQLNIGIKGAAIATVISQIAAFLFLISYLTSKKTSLRLQLDPALFEISVLSEIIKVGMASLLRQIFTAFKIILINNLIIISYTGLQLAAFGIMVKIQSIFLMPVFGILQGLSPVAGFNHGAKRPCNVKSAIYISIFLSTAFLIIFWSIIMIFPDNILSFFSSEASFVDSSDMFMRIFFLLLPLSGFQIIICGVLQSIGDVRYAFISNILRDGVIPIFVLLISYRYLNSIGIWLCFPVSEMISAVFILYIFKKEFKNICVRRAEDLLP